VLFAATIGAPPGGITDVFIRIKITELFITNFVESDHQDIPAKGLRDFVVKADFFIISTGGATISWELVGPAVPAGIYCDKAKVIMFRS